MGSAALYYLSGTGAKVIGIEQFDSLHEKGSYSGYTRIIRKAYFEHPDYVPLLHSAYNEWYNLEEKCSENFFHQTGLLYIDSENGPIGDGVSGRIRYGSKLSFLPSASRLHLHQACSGEFKKG